MSREPMRVLQVVPAMNAGGLETFIMNVYRALDRSRVQFDFLYHYDMPCFYDEEITALGGRITKLTVRQDNRLGRYRRQLAAFFAAHPEYAVLHGHYAGFGMFYNPIAQRAGIAVRAGHSHNTSYEKNLVGQLDRAMSSRFSRTLTHRFACGQKAGEVLFKKDPFTVLPNGVDAARFAQPDKTRAAELRRSLGVGAGEVLFGHVGRFTQQKNHLFLLEAFAGTLARFPAAHLVLIGEGGGLAAARAKAQSLGVAQRAHFVGVQRDMPAWYAAMDGFLLPSLFEGLPVSLVEAEAAGVPALVSSAVEAEAAFAKNVRFLQVNSLSTWVDGMLALARQRPAKYPDALAETRAARYDIVGTASYLEAFYLEQGALHPRR